MTGSILEKPGGGAMDTALSLHNLTYSFRLRLVVGWRRTSIHFGEAWRQPHGYSLVSRQPGVFYQAPVNNRVAPSLFSF